MKSRADKVALVVLEGLGNAMWGFRPLLMPVIVERRGGAGAVAWFGWNMPRYEHTRWALGPLRTNLLATTISLVNGCRYCAFGHAYALQLVFLRDHGRLFPLDEHEIVQLCGRDGSEIRVHLARALTQACLDGEQAWVERTLALMSRTLRPQGRTDARLAHLVRMFRVLNGCGIAGDVPPDQAHDPVNKDRALKAHYRRLRASPPT